LLTPASIAGVTRSKLTHYPARLSLA